MHHIMRSKRKTEGIPVTMRVSMVEVNRHIIRNALKKKTVLYDLSVEL